MNKKQNHNWLSAFYTFLAFFVVTAIFLFPAKPDSSDFTPKTDPHPNINAAEEAYMDAKMWDQDDDMKRLGKSLLELEMRNNQ